MTETIKAIAVASGYNNSAVGSGTYTITATPVAATPTFSPTPGNYNGSVTVTLSDATSGAVIHCTTDGSTPTASSPACTSLTLTTTTTIQAIAVASGYNNSAVASGTYTISPTDFSLSATPSSQSVVQGNSTTYTVTVAPSGGFAGTVGFTVSGLPQGGSGMFNPSSVTTSGSSTLTIGTLSSTTAGSYPLTITAASGTLIHTTTVTLVVTVRPDYSISVAPTSATLNRGSSTQYTATITGQGGFSGTVQFSVKGLTQRTTGRFNPTSVVGSGISTLTVSANKSAVPGTYPLTITATSGALAHSSSVSLTIQ